MSMYENMTYYSHYVSIDFLEAFFVIWLLYVSKVESSDMNRVYPISYILKPIQLTDIVGKWPKEIKHKDKTQVLWDTA